MARVPIPRSAPARTLAQQPPLPGGDRPDHSIATAPAPSTGQADAQTNSEASTYFTKANGQTEVLYNADRLWATVTLTLETAGPVAVGFKSQITPVLSGKGLLLQTGVPTKFVVAKGNGKLYIASTSINRISVQVEPLPWLEQIAAAIGIVAEQIGGGLRALVARK